MCCHGNHFCLIRVAIATVSGHFTFFEIKNIKFQYYYLQSSKFQKYWEKFTLVNNSLVWHQLLVIHVYFRSCTVFFPDDQVTIRGCIPKTVSQETWQLYFQVLKHSWFACTCESNLCNDQQLGLESSQGELFWGKHISGNSNT